MAWPDPALVLATDTGITAALGLVQGARFEALASESTIIWLRTVPSISCPSLWPSCLEMGR
ncbi:MAG: hypothetical protein ACREWG_04265 [Gammaproteobacteria bacterium]